MKTLVIVPDGALRTIPISALHDGKGFVIERYAVATTPAVALTQVTPAPIKGQMLFGGISADEQEIIATL